MGKWKHFADPGSESFCMIYKNAYSAYSKALTVDKLINCLSLLVGRYLGNSREWLKEPFYEVFATAVY